MGKKRGYILLILTLVVFAPFSSAFIELNDKHNNLIISEGISNSITNNFYWNNNQIKLSADVGGPFGTVKLRYDTLGNNVGEIYETTPQTDLTNFRTYSPGTLDLYSTKSALGRGVTAYYSLSSTSLIKNIKTGGLLYPQKKVTYDPNGEVTKVEYPNLDSPSNEKVIYISRDYNGNINSITEDGSTVTYTYDSEQRLTSLGDPNELNVIFNYDNSKNLVKSKTFGNYKDSRDSLSNKFCINGDCFVSKDTYSNSLLTSDAFSNYYYDSYGRLIKKCSKGMTNYCANYDYYSNNDLNTTLYPDGSCEKNYYDLFDNLVEIESFKDCSVSTPISFYVISDERNTRQDILALGATTYTENQCGNDVIESGNGEQCDDGNLINGDGCSSTCKIEKICEDSLYDTKEANKSITASGNLNDNKNNMITLVNGIKSESGYASFKTTDSNGWQCPVSGLQPGLTCIRNVDISLMNGYFPSNETEDGSTKVRFFEIKASNLKDALEQASKLVETEEKSLSCDNETKVNLGITKVETIDQSYKYTFEYELSCASVNVSVASWDIDSQVYGVKSCNQG